MAFCNNCGAENTGSEFCPNCGQRTSTAEQVEQPGKYQQLGNYGQYQQQPQMRTPEPWTGGSLVDAVKKMYLNTDLYAKTLIEDMNAPNSYILAAIAIVTSTIAAILASAKTVTVYEDAQMESIMSGYSGIFSSESMGILSIFIVILVWLIGSWILGLFVKGGLPYGTYSHHNVTTAMLKLNAYRLVATLVISIPQIIYLLFAPDIVITVHANGTTTIDAGMYYPLMGILTIISAVISLYLLYRGVNALDYNGSGLYFVLFILLISRYIAIRTYF